MGQVHKLKTSYAVPTFAHAVETFLVVHTAADDPTARVGDRLRVTTTEHHADASQRPGRRAVNTIDLCPVAGRVRLSYYRRAAEIFEHATRPLAYPVDRAQGFTLHQLRHAMPTYEAENATNTPTPLVCSRHASVHSLERSAQPGLEVAAIDPPAGRRQRR